MKDQKRKTTAPKPPSMATIAAKAGVHKMTVSRALNGSGRISPETKERILKLAEELGYTKNNLVANVMSTVALGRYNEHSVPLVFLNDVESDLAEKGNRTIKRLMAAATDRAAEHGFNVEVMRYRDGTVSQKRLNTIIEARGIQGVLINSGRMEPAELHLNCDRLAVVTLGNGFSNQKKFHRVQSDIYQMLKTTIDQLNSRGYQRVGMILNADTYPDYHDISKSVFLLHQADQPHKNKVKILEKGWSLTKEEFLKWFWKQKPDAIISYQLQPLKWLRKEGISVPEDVGFAMVTLSEEARSEHVSGMHFDKGLLAAIGVDILIRYLLSSSIGMPNMPQRHLLSGTWIPGETLRKS